MATLAATANAAVTDTAGPAPTPTPTPTPTPSSAVQLTSLPYDILVLIAGSTDFDTLWTLRQTCRLFENIYQQSHAHQQLRAEGIEIPPLSPPLRLLHAITTAITPTPTDLRVPPLLPAGAPLRLTDSQVGLLRDIEELIRCALAASERNQQRETQLPPSPSPAQIRAAWNYLFVLAVPVTAKHQLSVYELWELWFLHAAAGPELERAWQGLALVPTEVNETTTSPSTAIEWGVEWKRRLEQEHRTIGSWCPTPSEPWTRTRIIRRVVRAVIVVNRFSSIAVLACPSNRSRSWRLLPDVAPTVGLLAPKEALWRPCDFTSDYERRPDCRGYFKLYQNELRAAVHCARELPYPPTARVPDVLERVLAFLDEALEGEPAPDYHPLPALGAAYCRHLAR